MRILAQRQYRSQLRVAARPGRPHTAPLGVKPQGLPSLRLQSTIGNQAVKRLLQAKGDSTAAMIDASRLFWTDVNKFFPRNSAALTAHIASTAFASSQQEPLLARPRGGGSKAYDIVIGQAYVDQRDDYQRQMILFTALRPIAAFSTDRFEQITDPELSSGFLNNINPPYRVGQYCAQNCPATADALEEYLRTGTINKAICDPVTEQRPGYGFDVAGSVFSGTFASWRAAKAQITSQLKKHGDFVVVEGTRSQAQMQRYNLTQWHYFTVVNVKNKLFVIDAFNRGQVTDNLDAYAGSLQVTSYKLVVGEFVIKKVRGP